MREDECEQDVECPGDFPVQGGVVFSSREVPEEAGTEIFISHDTIREQTGEDA
jgi:hypothetical protein